MRGRLWLGVLMVVAALVVTACGGGGGQQTGGQQGGTTGAAVNVSEKEWVIELSSATLKAGSVKFVIKNEGAIEHNFVIQGANVEVDAIVPGGSKEITVDLKPGTYTIVCNIPGHEEAGMKVTLTVSQ